MRESARFAAVNPKLSLAALHDRMIVFAQDQLGGLIHIDSARRGKACNCRCLACDEALIARHGDIKAHSFAHASGNECQFAVDAVLNRLAQELIAAARVFVTPPMPLQASCTGPGGPIRRAAVIEARRLSVDCAAVDRRVHPQRPSVVMKIGGRELLLELTYGHRLDARKRGAIERLGLAAIEMHVGDGMFETVEQFEHQLLEETGHKHWIFNPKARALQAELDALIAEELDRQHAARAREREAASLAQAAQQQATKAALDQKWRDQALHESMQRQMAAQAAAASQAGAPGATPPHLPTLHYRLRDGGLSLRHEPGGGVLLAPDTGNEAVLRAFASLGLVLSAERGGYLATTDQIEAIMLALRPFQLSVKSV